MTGKKKRGGDPDPNPKPAPSVKPCMSGGTTIPCALPFTSPRAATPAPSVDVRTVASSAALQLDVPAPTPIIGPNPARNKWNMIPVGFPIWVWTEHPRTLNAATTQEGITITMTATAGPTTVSFGDGTTITCQTMTRRPPVLDPAEQPSPDCGHVYSNKATYSITATTTWTVTWQALDESGTLTLTNTAATSLRVGELSAVLVPGP
ncbi:hypothetical protein ACQB6R_04875 [Propionibacteriaceae bacterium G1746]|uniref:hypothetical protein n=1 Tax=Aestuariimicrobium sp. G57 TaxID=3418485 RepID=UPI003C1E25A4